jgi:pSer/pThr/pTyr-binding forkhead associated (FHA) protein
MSKPPQAISAAARPVEADCALILEPLSHPELGPISIDDALFAVGRFEPPFDGYPHELVAELSRRHARIFCEHGAVHIADLGSRNGTAVNGADIRHSIRALKEGDEIRFGRALSYRVKMGAPGKAAPMAAPLRSLTLTPEHPDSGLQSIVISEFPFLIGKAESAFARYRDSQPTQVAYLSRRHAHIFLRRGMPFVEDLGSTNGSFVDGKRLQEHATPLEDGSRIAFGGQHFAYVVSLQWEDVAADAGETRLAQNATVAPKPAPVDADKTTFVAAADSFLDIFCVTPQSLNEPKDEAAKPAADEAPARQERGHRGMAAELLRAFAGEDGFSRRRLAGTALVLIALIALAAMLVLRESPEDQVRALLASGADARAAELAGRQLQKHPDDASMKALDTEATLKAWVPPWLAALHAGRDGEAQQAMARMTVAASSNDELPPLLAELDWVGRLQRFTAARGGPDGPLRIYADEAPMRELLAWWDRDANAHQRQLSRIAALAPAFRDAYAEALSQVRRLKSDGAVYLAAMDRLDAAITAELKQDRLNAVPALLDDYAGRYPRLGGLDRIRADLALYRQAEEAAAERRLGRMVALLDDAKFATPPFQAKFRELSGSARFPPQEVAQRYRAVAAAWRAGDAQQALSRLQAMSGGPWGDAVAAELARKKTIVEQFGAVQKGHGAAGQKERALGFYALLNPLEDGWFLRASGTEVAPYRRQAQAEAQELIGRARAQWGRYREGGGIEGRQRLEPTVSDAFRARARLLAEARDNAQRGLRLLRQVGAEPAAQDDGLRQQIDAEMAQQRRALLDERAALEPAVFRAKLALLGGDEDGERGGEKRLKAVQ